MEIIYKNTSELVPYENNARTHSEYQIEQIIDSINEYGFTNPILIDEYNMVIAGHGRLEAATEMGMQEVPCIILKGLTEAQKKAYIIADNKMALNAGWDDDLLKQELEQLQALGYDLALTGFDKEEIDDILGLEDSEIEIEEDNVPEPPEEPISKKGQIYQLGEHRLMIGDSTNEYDVAKLMDGELADLVITDPPYNVAIVGGNHSETPEQRKANGGKTIENDQMESGEFRAFLIKAFQNVTDYLKEGGAFYVWYASREVVNFSKALEKVGLTVKQELIWNKSSLVMGRQDYQWKHEPCLYGWKEGQAHYFIDDRTKTTIIDEKPIDFSKKKKEELVEMLEQIYAVFKTTIIDEKRPARNELHPTMKPVNLIATQIKNSSVQKEKVLDLFGGSGTTLIACEQLHRQCYMMEYDPHYADVIIERWEELTGKEAILISE